MSRPIVTHQELIDALRQTAYALGSDLPVRIRAHRAAMDLAERAEAMGVAASGGRSMEAEFEALLRESGVRQ